MYQNPKVWWFLPVLKGGVSPRRSDEAFATGHRWAKNASQGFSGSILLDLWKVSVGMAYQLAC